MSESDTRKIVEKECSDFSEEIVGKIVSLSNGYPYIARLLAYISDKKESEGDMLVFLNTLKDKDMEHTLNSIHKRVLTTLEKDSREIIKKLAIAPPVLTLPLIEAFCGEDVDTSLGEVIERGILREDVDRLSIYHPLFRDYLQKIQRISHKNKRMIYSEAMENVKSDFDSIILLFDVINEPDIFKKLIKITDKCEVLNSIGRQIYVLGKINEAAFAWSHLLNVATSENDNKWKSIATCNLGNIYQIQGDMEKALEHYEKALKIDEEIGNKQGIASDLGNMGVIYRIQGDLGKALEHHEKALEIDERIGNKQGIATHLGNIGTVYQIQGDMEKSLEHHEKSLEIDEEIGNKRGMATNLGNMGIVYRIQGNIGKALEHHERALEIDEGIGNKQGVATHLGNIGTVYQIQGDMEKSLEHHENALEMDEVIGNKQGMATHVGNIGNIYQVQGSMEKALERHEMALEIDEVIGNQQGMASHYNNIAVIYQKQGDIQKVLEHLEKSLKIFKDIGDNPNKALILVNIGLIYFNKGEKSIALDYLLDAQDIAIDYAPHLFEEISEMVNGLLEIQ